MPQLGELTQWGWVSAIGILQGERYYWFTHSDGSVTMLPAVTVEQRPS